MSRSLVLGTVAAALCLAQTPPTVPYTVIQINGTQQNQNAGTSASYRAYQRAAGLRIVCQEPCTLDPNLIYAKYAGILAAQLQLLKLVGAVDHVAEGTPFDYHIQGDSFCGPYQAGYTADAGFYQTGGSFGCFWDVEKPNQTYPLTVANAQRIEAQLLFVHEYGHTLFYNRHFASYEDAVKAFSIYVSGIDTIAPGQADLCDPAVGRFTPLFHELCLRNGFGWADFAPVMREMDRVFQARLGTMFAGSGGKPITSVRVFRRALDSHLGSDTRPAFAAARFTPYDTGGDAVLPAAGGTVSFAGGAVTLDIPAGALAANTPVVLDSAYGAVNISNLSFQQMFRLLPNGITFSKSVRMTIQYNPATLEPAGASESRLRLWQLNAPYPGATSWLAVGGQQLNTTAHTISGNITSTGQFGYFVQ